MEKAGTETDKLKNQKVYYHRVGTKQEEDVCVYKDESQPDWMFDAEVTNDGKFVLIGTRKDCNHVNLLSYVDITTEKYKNLDCLFEPTSIVSEWIGEFSYLQNHDNAFFFKSNYQAQKSKILKIDFQNPDKANWVDILPEVEAVLEDARCCNDLIIANYIENASE